MSISKISNTNIASIGKILNKSVTDSYTSLLLHCDGTDGSTTFTDSSPSGHTVTVYGDAQVDTAQKKFGTGSALFDNPTNWADGDYLLIPDSSDFYLGANDFTVEFCCKVAGVNNYGYAFGQCDVVGSYVGSSFVLGHTDTGFPVIIIYHDGNNFARVIGTTSINDGEWHHLAGIRYSNTLKLYVDGVSEGTPVDITGYTVNNSPSHLGIGRPGSWEIFSFNGWMDEIRLSKSIARWTSNFTPPTSPHTSTSLSKILGVTK